MPDLPASPAEPWLAGMVVTVSREDADAVRDALRDRGLGTRSVPGGPARAAWTCVDGDIVLGLVVQGVEPDAGRRAAGYWMPRARTVAVLSAGRGTGLVPPPAIVVAGDAALVRRALAATGGDLNVVEGVVAPVSTAPRTAASLASLAGAGVAATSLQADAWLDAAAALGRPAIAVAGVDDDPAEERRLATAASGAARALTRLGAVLHAGGRPSRPAGAPPIDAAAAAARCAVGALLGPR